MKQFALPADCRYAVIGDPVGHSRSPQMQNAAFSFYQPHSAPYGKVAVTADELADWCAFARSRLAGFNVTVPHKQAILSRLDEISPLAAKSQSVNTVSVLPDGRLAGDTTDGYGLAAALRANFGLEPAGWGFALLGAGGAATAIAFYLAEAGAHELILVNRTAAKAEELAARLRQAYPVLRLSVWRNDDPLLGDALMTAAVTIQATSLGLHPDDPLPIPEAALIRARTWFDTIYLPTPALHLARQYDIPCAGGADMLLYQGARAFEIWTGRPAPVEVMRAALNHS